MKKQQSNNYELGTAGKFALYDMKTGTRITEYEFDRIIANFKEKPVVIKCEDLVDGSGKHFVGVGKITYSAIADENGNLTEIPGYTLGYRDGFYNGTCIAYEESTKKYRLVNDSGKVLSDAFSNLEPANRENVFGLYKNIEQTKNNNLKNVDIVFENGKVLEYVAKEINYDSEYKRTLQIFRFPEIDTIKKATDAVKKYGANLIEFLPNSIFESRENYLELLFAVNDYVVKNKRSLREMLYTIGLLTNIFSEINPAKTTLPELKLPKKLAGESDGLQTKVAEYITQLYNILS